MKRAFFIKLAIFLKIPAKTSDEERTWITGLCFDFWRNAPTKETLGYKSNVCERVLAVEIKLVDLKLFGQTKMDGNHLACFVQRAIFLRKSVTA